MYDDIEEDWGDRAPSIEDESPRPALEDARALAWARRCDTLDRPARKIERARWNLVIKAIDAALRAVREAEGE